MGKIIRFLAIIEFIHNGKINLNNISVPKKTLIVDANNVISKEKLIKLKKKKLKIFSVGRDYIE